ncbi:hypothetical protein J5N97_021650 [Dioscorea zingiberensis]|uniref:S-acyltransferase n=1 Tax=Dioscorea zingiberensis TaxID=325984 RepID=A0A9D5C999_9LILI|nr:hypothetical protein J5N97_021650 [Dioscorea zingiberensis]
MSQASAKLRSPSPTSCSAWGSRLATKLAAEILKRLFPAPTRRGLLGRRNHHQFVSAMDCGQTPANPFHLCSGLRALGYLMILMVAAIIGVTYYAVVIVAWGPRLLRGGLSSALALLVLGPFHLLLVLLLWSYFMVVFRDPGKVPINWRPAFDEETLEMGSSVPLSDSVAHESRLSTESSSELERRPNIGYCNICQNNKPPRSHHCSVCQRCVLKMDHHCVWVVNCVGARNYKFFLLFLLYTFLEMALDTLALLPHFITFFGDAVNHTTSSTQNLAVTFIAFVLNLALLLSLLCFVVMHTSLVLSNTTTIEVYEKKKAVAWKYDLGRRKNFEQVFGSKKILWFLPIFSKEDLENIPALGGLDFPTHSDVEA